MSLRQPFLTNFAAYIALGRNVRNDNFRLDHDVLRSRNAVTQLSWWTYYYLHTATPLCWCAGIGIAFLIERVRGAKPENSHEAAAGRRRNPQARTPALRRLGAAFALIALGICGVGWMGARVYLQVQTCDEHGRLKTRR
jgi:hypothetical protein